MKKQALKANQAFAAFQILGLIFSQSMWADPAVTTNGQGTYVPVVSATAQTDVVPAVMPMNPDAAPTLSMATLPPLPTGAIRAASNVNFAFKTEQAGANENLYLMNLQTGQSQKVGTLYSTLANGAHFSPACDVSPDGATVIYGYFYPIATGGSYGATYAQSIFDPAKKMLIAAGGGTSSDTALEAFAPRAISFNGNVATVIFKNGMTESVFTDFVNFVKPSLPLTLDVYSVSSVKSSPDFVTYSYTHVDYRTYNTQYYVYLVKRDGSYTTLSSGRGVRAGKVDVDPTGSNIIFEESYFAGTASSSNYTHTVVQNILDPTKKLILDVGFSSISFANSNAVVINGTTRVNLLTLKVEGRVVKSNPNFVYYFEYPYQRYSTLKVVDVRTGQVVYSKANQNNSYNGWAQTDIDVSSDGKTLFYNETVSSIIYPAQFAAYVVSLTNGNIVGISGEAKEVVFLGDEKILLKKALSGASDLFSENHRIDLMAKTDQTEYEIKTTHVDFLKHANIQAKAATVVIKDAAGSKVMVFDAEAGFDRMKIAFEERVFGPSAPKVVPHDIIGVNLNGQRLLALNYHALVSGGIVVRKAFIFNLTSKQKLIMSGNGSSIQILADGSIRYTVVLGPPISYVRYTINPVTLIVKRKVQL